MLSYKYLIIPFISAVISQTIKVLIEGRKTHKINLKRFIDGMGGMPSTHSSLTTSLTTLIYLNYGVTSILFAVSLFFSLIVIYDSMGIRYESGNQAKIINKVVGTNLKEKLGHTPLEVLSGVILGISIGIIMNTIFT